MNLLRAVDDFVLSDVGMAPALVTNGSERLGFGTRRREGVAGSVFFGAQAQPAIWEVVFRCPDLAARNGLLAALGGAFDAERRLLGQRDDLGRDLVVAHAALLGIEERNALDLVVRFESGDSVWRARAATTVEKTFTTALDRVLRVAVPGNAPTAPVVTLTPLAQRTARTAAVGWSWRQRWTVTNTGEEPWFRLPIRVSFGSTAALVSGGKMLASGNDLRVWLEGLEQPRTLVGMNSGDTRVWVIVPALAVGASLVFDIVYGNPSAGAAPALTYPDIPAFELAGSSNAQWIFPVGEGGSNAGKGLWWLSKGTEGAVADFGVPGAWQPVLTYDNPGNTDDTAQLRSHRFVNGSTVWYQAIMSASRAAAGVGVPGVEAANPYDGVAIQHPIGIASLSIGFTIAASYPNIASVVVLARDSGAEGWARIARFSATGAVAQATYGPTAPVNQMAVAIWPANDISLENEQNVVPETPAYLAAISSGTYWSVNLVTTGLTIAQTTGEQAIYEIAAELRLGGGSELIPPYRSLLVGNARGAQGAGTPRLACTLSQAVVIDAEARSHSVWTASLATEVEEVSAHAVRAVVGRFDRGSTAEFRTSEWLPLAPPRTLVPNAAFDADIGSWNLDWVTAGVTGSVAHDPAVGGEANGSLKVTATATAAGFGVFAMALNGRRFGVNGREAVEVAAWVRQSSANMRAALGVLFYNDAGAEVFAAVQPEWATAPVALAEYRRVFATRVPAGATEYRIGLAARPATAIASGSVWFDDITCNDNELTVADPSVGMLKAGVSVRGRWV